MEKNNNDTSHDTASREDTFLKGEEGERKDSLIYFVSYNQEKFKERKVKEGINCLPLEPDAINWIHVKELDHVSQIRDIVEHFQLHPLTVEDLLNFQQRPKLEDFESYIFIKLKFYYKDNKEDVTRAEQISLILGSKYLLTFQESKVDIFSTIRNKIKAGKGRIRKMGEDYLLYVFLDVILDSYFMVLEKIEEKIEDMEEDLAVSPSQEELRDLHDLRRELINIRKSVWPLREVMTSLERVESPFIREETGRYFRDIYDHSVQLLDTVETLREVMASMLEVYLTGVSNKTNEVMKVLTVIATIFIPLTFIAGVYGMNFAYMPELEWRWGYPLIMVVMLGIAGTMLTFFKKRGWL